MSIMVKGNGEFENPPEGMHAAVCVNVFDLGDQPGFQGKIAHKVVVMFELDVRKAKGEFAGKRFLISKFYTASLNEKATLRKDLEAWRGRAFTTDELKGFDLENVKGHGCNLNLIKKAGQDGTEKIVISAIVPRFKGQEEMKAETPADYVPEWIAKMMTPVAAPQNTTTDTFEDDIPF